MKLSYSEVRARCLKPDESVKPWYPRIITHAISTRLIWLLQDAPLTPNLLTLLSLIAAYASIPFLARMTPGSVLAGALLIEIYYVLDAVDGQWARLKKMKSLTGAFFDVMVNYAIHPPIFFAIGWGVFQRTLDERFILFGFLGAFDALWVMLLGIVRAAVQVGWSAGGNKASGGVPAAGRASSLPKQAFGWLHKSLVFPWFMYVLSVSAIISFVLESLFFQRGFTVLCFSYYLVYYAFIGASVAVLMTVYWIAARIPEKN